MLKMVGGVTKREVKKIISKKTQGCLIPAVRVRVYS